MSSDFSTYFQARDTQYSANGALKSYAEHSKDSGLTRLFHQIGQFFKSIVGLSDYQKAYRALYGSLTAGGVLNPNARRAAVRILDFAAGGSCPTNEDVHELNKQMQIAEHASNVAATVFLPFFEEARLPAPILTPSHPKAAAAAPAPSATAAAPAPSAAEVRAAKIEGITVAQKHEVRNLARTLPDVIAYVIQEEEREEDPEEVIASLEKTIDNEQFYEKVEWLVERMDRFSQDDVKAYIKNAARILGM